MWTLTQPQTIHNYWPIPMHNYWLHRSKRRITKHINNFRLKKKNETVLILIIENMYQCCIKKSNGKMKIKSDHALCLNLLPNTPNIPNGRSALTPISSLYHNLCCTVIEKQLPTICAFSSSEACLVSSNCLWSSSARRLCSSSSSC